MKLLSDATEYGLRAIVWLSNQPREPHKVQTIAEATDAASGYLIKVLQTLAKAGIVSAHRGTTGGYAMARDPETLTVLEVISAIDPIERIRACPLGLPAHASSLCPLHRRIDDSLASIERDFARTTIAELAIDRSSSDRVCTALSLSAPCKSPPCDRITQPKQK
ncbi:MAG: Rrf2 family transcriptional regulator [Phycisphaeraceae bacterium]|nr:Rrf2 family transcriptional regulator [Phycisphaeraceae bacterium]MCW5762893.1 Rrf2 family transcriptional regulator [Phycisphaeraceae bacterium]